MSSFHEAPDEERTPRARMIAFYLPQFHPIPENDRWWGKGFTEWTNTAKAKPLFRGHHQPNLPADLGFYDLRVPETRAAQAELAHAHGVEAFCYWHYWFAGERLLERPFREVLRSGEPDFPFCLGWANQTWTGVWYGAPERILKEQTYPGLQDHEAHFYTLLEAFADPRYLTVEGKPFLLVFRPQAIPGCERVVEFWRKLADKAGLKGLHLVGVGSPAWSPEELGFDAFTVSLLTQFTHTRHLPSRMRRLIGSRRLTKALFTRCNSSPLDVYPYEQMARSFVLNEPPGREYYPSILPNWDNTPRSGKQGCVLHGSTPARFQQVVREAVTKVGHLPRERRIVMVQSWNEWAEGNYLEPDLRHGHDYLQALKAEVLG